MTRSLPLFFFCLLLAAGCDSGDDADAGPVCADCGRDSGAPPDAGSTAMDAGPTTMDAGPTDGGAALVDAAGPSDAAVPSSDAAEGAPCSLNRECAASQRCECDLATGCFCTTGARGTGVNGVDTCVDGDACASSLCVEGNGDTFYCSDECVTDADCAAALPRCLEISFVGRICAREPPDAGP